MIKLAALHASLAGHLHSAHGTSDILHASLAGHLHSAHGTSDIQRCQ